MKKITVVGSMNMDFVMRVKRQPELGETILGRSLELKPGGKGANQAYAAAYLGGEVTMLGAVGDDAFGHQLLDNLKQAGVSTEYIRIAAGVSTGSAFVAVNDEGDNSIIVIPGANDMVDRAYIDSVMPVIERSDIVILQLEIPIETVTYTLEKARAAGCMLILDPAPAQQLPQELLQGLDIVKPNQTEVMEVLGCTGEACEPENMLQMMRACGIRCPMITLGAEGSCAIDESGKRIRIPAVKVKAVDTTGAGDCFTGALAYSLALGHSLAEAMAFASKASAYSVMHAGAQSSYPALDDLAGLDCQ